MPRKIHREGLIVLVVEDDSRLLLAVARGLRGKGWSVLTALNPKAAAPLVEGADIVLSDWHMPLGGGREMVNQCWDSHTPLVVTSSDPWQVPPMLEAIDKADGLDATDARLFSEYHRYFNLSM